MGANTGGESDRRGLPERIGGKYLTVRAIASGGMGTVYEVEHEGTGERLALKLLKGFDDVDPTTLERFRREARVHARLKNEHIVRVIDADVAPELGGAPYLVMDLLEGQTLGELADDEPLPPQRVVELLAQIAPAIDQAHRAGIVHRDLKPDNLFVTRRPDGTETVKILDFGIAKFRDGTDTARTSTGALVGTPLYMAREQAAGEHDLIGPGTDVWSMAMIAHRLLTGRDYWTSGNVSLLLADLVSKPVKAPSTREPRLGGKFDAWFLRSCAPAPGDRWTSVIEQIAALARALDVPEPPPVSGRRVDETLPATGAVAVATSPASQSLSGSVASAGGATARSRGPVVGVVLGVAALLAIGSLVATSRKSTPEPAQPARSIPSTAAVSAETNRDPAVETAPKPSPAPTASAAPSASVEDAGVPKRNPPRAHPVPPRPSSDPLSDPK